MRGGESLKYTTVFSLRSTDIQVQQPQSLGPGTTDIETRSVCHISFIQDQDIWQLEHWVDEMKQRWPLPMGRCITVGVIYSLIKSTIYFVFTDPTLSRVNPQRWIWDKVICLGESETMLFVYYQMEIDREYNNIHPSIHQNGQLEIRKWTRGKISNYSWRRKLVKSDLERCMRQ